MSEEPTLQPLDSFTGFLLFRAGRAVTTQIETAISELGITLRHHGVMTLLAIEPMSQAALVEKLGVDRTTMVSIIDELEHMAFVKRERNPQDRRAHLVTVTEQGRTILLLAQSRIRQEEEIVFAAFSPTERQQFRAFLKQLIPYLT